mgnify:CR=1 FL=1
MLLTEMTLLVRAYKQEVNTERAKVQATAHMGSSLSRPTSGRPGSRPQSSKPASLASSRSSSRPQSRQRPHTANPMIRDSGKNGQDGSSRSEWEREQEEDEEDKRHIMALRQVAHAPVKIAVNKVQRMEKDSIRKRMNIADQLGDNNRRRGGNTSHGGKDRPTTAPLQRKPASKSSVLSLASKRKRKALKSASHAPRRHGAKEIPIRSEYNSNLANGSRQRSRPGSGTNQGSLWTQNQPYVPSALIRTSLRDGFVHSSHGGIQMPEPLIMSESAPQLHTRPKSSPFIRFGSTGIQELLERKRRNLQSRG